MNNTFPHNKFFILSNRLNLAAGIILVFNFLNPHLAFAETPQNFDDLEATLRTNPVSRIMLPAAKPVLIHGVITAYTSTPDQTDGNPTITASGTKVNEYTIAANGLPFGTVIKIPSLFGDRSFIVSDRMNARYGFGRFDVWFNTSRAEALKFGVKRVAVEIYYPEQKLASK